jgi:ATP-binding cassette subfamily F protein 3
VSLLEVAGLAFGYTDEPVFENVTFRLRAGDRASLVAPNGVGKTTLLRIIAGELAPDRGSVLIRHDARIGYCRQSHEFDASGTVRDVLFSGFGELLQLRSQLGEAQQRAASGAAGDLARLAELTDRYQHAGADQLERRVETIAFRLGFGPKDMERTLSSLSGGERGRLQLGVVLADSPEILLLDEPTNHLDLQTISWLEPHLMAWKGAVLVVSHDRAFLDAVCPVTLQLGRPGLRSYPLPYSQYHAARAADLEREGKAAERQAALVSQTEDFIRRNLAGQKAKQAQSRRKMLARLSRVDRPEDTWAQAQRLGIRFAEAPRTGDLVLEAEGLTAARAGRVLFAGFDLLVRRGDRIGVVGPNGCGKSTLLALLAGRGMPGDRGTVRRGTNLREGFFDQYLGSLDSARTCVEEIRSVRADLNDDGARQYLARFRFYGDDPFRNVRSLSGGEHTRLALAKLLLEPRNLLFLDEPTNHLDIPATEILEEALIEFPGTVLLVSHDRRFLENVTSRTIAFESNGLCLYEGGFAEYAAMLRRSRAEQTAEPRRASAAQAAEHPAGPAANPSAERQTCGAERHRNRRASARQLERKQRRVKQLEDAISEAERELAELQDLLHNAPGDDWERLHEYATREQQLSDKVERMLAQWASLSEQLAAEVAGASEVNK